MEGGDPNLISNIVLVMLNVASTGVSGNKPIKMINRLRTFRAYLLEKSRSINNYREISTSVVLLHTRHKNIDNVSP